jgi:RNA polymerase sigma-70 factor, ECF subfamily
MAAPALENAFAEHRSFLWSLCYRLCGDAADAEDLVQETFVRALQHPPARTEAPWRPWLVKVALNLGRDLLRRRRRRGYVGPWLPAPVDEPAAPEGAGPAARYDRLESVTVAFLLALEALTPAQRAVLLLRDVFDYSVREAAQGLEMSEASVRTTHLRARRRMQDYDRARVRPGPALQEGTRQALARFLTALQEGDAKGVAALLAEDAAAVSDGGGEFAGARRVVHGRANVTAFFVGLARKAGQTRHVSLRTFNGLPAVVIEVEGGKTGWAPRVVFQCDLDADGLIRRVYTSMSSRKLRAVPR